MIFLWFNFIIRWWISIIIVYSISRCLADNENFRVLEKFTKFLMLFSFEGFGSTKSNKYVELSFLFVDEAKIIWLALDKIKQILNMFFSAHLQYNGSPGRQSNFESYATFIALQLFVFFFSSFLDLIHWQFWFLYLYFNFFLHFLYFCCLFGRCNFLSFFLFFRLTIFKKLFLLLHSDLFIFLHFEIFLYCFRPLIVWIS